jgi:signal transduction histidine kinase
MTLAKANQVDRILAVDDIPDNLFLLKTVLEDEGYLIYTAQDGQTALSMIEQEPPDLILLDVMMPKMDGCEVTRRIRENKKLPHIPILLITAHIELSPVDGLDAGADDFIRKPFDPDELMARVRSLLRLKHSIDEREEIARQREDFISRLTHDLRTPLVAADRMMNLIRQGAFCEVTPMFDEALGTMIRSNQNLLQMVNTLLEVHRHEAGSKAMTFASCNLAEVIQEVVQELTPLAEEKGLLLSFYKLLEPTNSFQITGDRLELRRVVMNLVGNAIKFTDNGAIDVSLDCTSSIGKDDNGVDGSSSKDWLIISVKDTGAGIPVEDLDHLFNRFRQGRHKRSDSGLGLYLSRLIVEAHQGRIEVSSELGQGSTFRVYLPIETQVVLKDSHLVEASLPM